MAPDIKNLEKQMWTIYTHKYYCKKVNVIGNYFTTKNSSPSIEAPVVHSDLD